MFTPETSSHFTRYEDPGSGVVSWLLKNETAPLQKLVYYVSKNWTKDCRWFWFVCAFPPGGWMEGSQQLSAVIDFETDQIYFHPDVPAGGACCDQDTGELYFCTPNKIMKKGPHPDDPVTLVARVPGQYRTFPGNMATHLTFSPDKRELCCDIHSGNEMYLTTLDIASGQFTLWQHRHGGWNHAQFNPVDGDLIMFSMEFWQDLNTGVHHIIDYDQEGHRTRTWTIRRGGVPERRTPMFRDQTHEWWSANGKYIYYTDKLNGIGRIDWRTGQSEMIYQTENHWMPYCWHAYSSADDMFFCADKYFPQPGNEPYRGVPSGTIFYNYATKKDVKMISCNPALYQPDEPCVYHIDPHPRFVMNDRYIAQVTTVTGQPTVAFTDVAQLKALTAL